MDTVQNPRPSGNNIPALDGFRAIAILIVMASHGGLEKIMPGRFGVTLFFFLSGYLITTLLRREFERDGKIDFAAFYLRRVVRIFPPMYLTIVVVSILSFFGLIRAINANGLIFDFLFLTNYFPTSGLPIGLWSLAVEEHFYLMFPLLFVLLIKRMSFTHCALVCLFLCLLVLGVRLWEVGRTENFDQVNFWSHTRMDSILFGCVLALWNNPVADPINRLPTRWPSYILACLILLSTFLIRDEEFRQTYRYTIQGLGLLILFNAAIRDSTFAGPILENRITRFVALHSYTLYLIHSALILLCEPLAMHIGLPLSITIAIVLSFAFAVGMHNIVEQPLGRWRRHAERTLRSRRQTAII